MSPISLGMDALLVTLLLAAMVVGLRLNGRLKALRQGQGDFVRAVGELDAAAARAEGALKALRAASEDTHDALLTRIETARGLLLRLDQAGEAATRAAALAQAAPTPAAAPVVQPPQRPASRLDPRFREGPAAGLVRPRVVPAARNIDDDLFEADDALGPLMRRAGAGR